ncbi:MAG: DUF4012 domain-containing protein [Candidatus Doudnabacteria bacterium]|nr:DUF4012 domain-containing protein [Candidatus Doudnabacteria bacterium]
MRLNRLDIGSIRKKEVIKPKAAKVLREVLHADLILVARNPKNPEPFAWVRKQEYVFSPKPLMSFATICLTAILVLQSVSLSANLIGSEQRILGMAVSAYEDLALAQDDLKGQDFTDAQLGFEKAQLQLDEIAGQLNQFNPLSLLSSKVRSAQALTSAALNIADAGGKLSSGMQILSQIKVSSRGVETPDFNAELLQNRKQLSEVYNLTAEALESLEKAADIPPEFAENVQTAKTETKKLQLLVKQLISLEDLYLSLFGSGSKDYLLIFQNLDEARANGGFIGSYGVLKVDGGQIEKLNIRSVYDFDGSLTLNLAAPGAMQPDIVKWGLRDANWFADFPTSARKMMYLFEKGSQTVDGVISLTPIVFEDILRMTGPVAMPQYGVILTDQNFQEVVQRKTSIEFDRKLNEPKKFLDDLAPVLLNKLIDLDPGSWLEMLNLLQRNLARRQIIIYPSEFDGRILSTDKDFLSIINSNVSGTKTDLEIEQEAMLESNLSADGAIINTFTLTRSNPTNETNKAFVRVLVPKNSTLLSIAGNDDLPIRKSQASGFITDPDLAALDNGVEADKTQFAFWLNLPPNSAKTVKLTYTLPFRAGISYSFLFQKQPAAKPIKFSSEFNASGFTPVWLSSGPRLFEGKIEFHSESLTDDFWSVVLEKQ